MLRRAVIKEVQPLLCDWITRATAQDHQGIRLLAAILKHKGEKLFRPQPRHSHATKHHPTSYLTAFSWTKPVTPLREMMNYRTLSELVYSKIFTPQTVEWVQHWLDLQDEDRYLALLMTLFRSLYTYYHTVNTSTITTHKSAFHSYSHSDLIRATQKLRVKPAPILHVHRLTRPVKTISQPVTRISSPAHIISAGKPKPVTWYSLQSYPRVLETSYQSNFKSHYFPGTVTPAKGGNVSISIILSPSQID